jgi:hypothetical protein
MRERIDAPFMAAVLQQAPAYSTATTGTPSVR